jgi:hypothetical protein
VRNARHGTSSRGAKGEPQNPRLSLSPLVLWRGFKHLTQITWPRRFAIVQFPNAPLIIALIAGETAKHTHGTSAAYASSVSYLAFAIWAYLELVEGVNWFRRLLGLVVATSATVHLALALHS